MVEPILYGGVTQLIIGLVLFAAAGYFASVALFGEKISLVEKIVFTIVLGFFIPTLVIFVLNYFLGLKIDSLAIAVIYAVIAAVAFWRGSRKPFLNR
ncbi:MAG: hypothetical protein AB1626_01470 [Candidatus Micrarchaeota archaeon]